MAIPDSDCCREIAVTQVTGLASRFRVTCENGLSMAMGWTPQLRALGVEYDLAHGVVS